VSKLKYALQLYTVRDYMDKDVAETLRKVKAIGYEYVEISGLHGRSNIEYRKYLKQSGLKAVSMHLGFEEVVDDPQNAAETAKFFDVKYLIIPMIDRKRTPDKAGWAACGSALDGAGKVLRENGIQLCYHNHAHEFVKIGNDYPYDILMGAADPENLAAEIDTFWVRYAGLSPALYITKYAQRCPVLHVKDMADARSKAFSEMGRGVMDWTEIFAAAVAAGTKWFVVEQDTCVRDSMESARISAIFMAEH